MLTTTRAITTPGSATPIPRLRLEPTGAARTLLDGGWWPYSTDPCVELPDLILAIDSLRGPITRLILSVDGWNPRPQRLAVAGRLLRLGYFASQPTTLLTARCDDGSRVDLLVVPPDTMRPTAEAAMALAATAGNRVHARNCSPPQPAHQPSPPTPNCPRRSGRPKAVICTQPADRDMG